MTTILRIHGTDYDLEGATSNAGLNVLIFMKKRLGISLKTIVGGLQRMQNSDDPLDILGDEEGLEAIQGLLWLIRTSAGERAADGTFFTLEQASDGIGFLDLNFINEDEDADGPKAPEPGDVEVAVSPS